MPPRPSNRGRRSNNSGGGSRSNWRKPVEPEPGRGRHGDTAEKEEAIELEGVVSAVLSGTMFRV